MRKLLWLASAAAMAISIPAVAKDQDRGHGRAAHDQKERAGKAQPAAKAHVRAGARADRRQARAQTKSRARAEVRADRRQAKAKTRAGVRARAEKRQDRREVAQRHQQRRAAAARSDHAREQRSAQRERTAEKRQRQQRVAARERVQDRRHEQRVAVRERAQDRGQRQQRIATRERVESRRDIGQDRRQRQQRLAARERWRDRELFYAQQARRYRVASYDWNDYDYRYLYRNVEPAYFRSASNFYPVGRSAPPAWAPAWGRRYNNVPYRYQDVYYDTPSNYYRYDDGYIYRVDSGSNLIADAIPLLGGGFAVGQLMPVGYDAYNVPYPYRDYYQDTDDAYYRYGDGGIFQVDPTTGMIEAIVALLAGDLNIGQPLPTGYDAYNLPFQYRDQYVDNDDYIYRYNDGNIYQADAQSGLIENVIAAAI